MNKKTLTGLLSVLCVLLCALVLLCACGGDNNPTDTGSTEVTTEASAPVTDPSTNEETNPETDPETVVDGKVTYTIIVVDADGNPVEGVDVQMCDVDGVCLLPVKTDANGVATFEKDEATYYVTIAACPEGFVADSETKHSFAEGTTEMTITLEKASAEQPTEAPTEEPTEAPTEPEKYPVWDADKAVVTHQSFDQLYKGNGSADDATNGGLNLFTPGQPAGWDKIADLTAGDITTLTYWGWVGVKGELGQFGYMIDDNAPIYNADWTFSNPGEDLMPHCPAGTDNASRMKISIDLADLIGEHSVRVLYKNAEGVEVTLGLFTVKLPVPPVVYVSNDAITVVTPGLQVIENVYPAGGYDEWDKTFTIKVGETGGYWDTGWIAINTDVYEFGYRFGGASPLNNGADFFPGAAYTVAATAEQIAAAQELGATTAAAFLCACAEAALGVGENHVQVLVKLNGDPNQVYVLREYTVILEA